MNDYTVLFNGNDLSQVIGVDLYNHDFNQTPERQIRMNKLARADKSIITSSEYSSKPINVFVEICSGSRSDTEATLVFLTSLVQAQNGTLVVNQAGRTVQYTATLEDIPKEWDGPKCYANLVFIASDPIAQQTTSQTLFTLNGITTTTANTSFIVDGSATAYPVITVAVNTVTGGTDKSISLVNAATNQGITITRTWSNGDLVVIDSTEMKVSINGSDIEEFTGLFPRFPAGTQQVKYTDNFTTRSVDITATYKPRLV